MYLVESIFGSFFSIPSFHEIISIHLTSASFGKTRESVSARKFKHDLKNLTLTQRNENCGLDNEFYIFTFGRPESIIKGFLFNLKAFIKLLSSRGAKSG